MSHVVLLGDSTLDNASYTAGGPDVISQVQQLLPPGWKATLSAVDGSTTEEIPEQLEWIPDDATHLILSVGGNNAILRADILEKSVASTGEAFDFSSGFRESDRAVRDWGCQDRARNSDSGNGTECDRALHADCHIVAVERMPPTNALRASQRDRS